MCPKLAILNETSGIINSPFYPRNYPANQTCSWQITASKGNHVVLIIENMEIRQSEVFCTRDHLEIQNASSFDGLYHLGGRRCGHYDYNFYLNYYYYGRFHYYFYCYDSYFTYCYQWPLIFHSHRESLKVLFFSDGSSSYRGFKATYVQVKRTAIITGRFFFYILYSMIHIYALLTKREVKMAGYWSSSFSSRSIKTQKKNEANIQPS